MLREACVENFTSVPTVIAKGAERIELCDNLAVGGTTVSYGVLMQTIAYCQPKNVPVMAIIRPRGGNFVYTDSEKDIILTDIKLAVQAGVDGIVVGALNQGDQLDLPFLTDIASTIDLDEVKLTFHMAFDEIPREDQVAALKRLSDIGFSRILTHGGPMQQPIFDHIAHLENLIEAAVPIGLTILPGGGVTRDNLPRLQVELAIQEAHGTQIV